MPTDTPNPIHTIMVKCDISRSEAAMAMNVNRSMVGHYLTGKRNPPPERLKMLAQYAALKMEKDRERYTVVAKVADREADMAARYAANLPQREKSQAEMQEDYIQRIEAAAAKVKEASRHQMDSLGARPSWIPYPPED